MPLYSKIHRQDDVLKNLPNGSIRSIYNIYRSQRSAIDSAHELPRVCEIAQDDYLGLGEWVIQLSPHGTGDYLYEHVGAAVANSLGYSMAGRLVSGGPGRPYAFFKQCFDLIQETREPILTESSAVLTPSIASWKRLLLPCQDDTGGLRIIGVLHAISWQEQMIEGLLRVTQDPIIVIKMVRNQGRDVIDAQIVELNEAAEHLLNVSDRRHLLVSDCAPELLSTNLLETVKGAYSKDAKVRYEKRFQLNATQFDGMSATHCGDGAILVLNQARQAQPFIGEVREEVRAAS